MNSLLGLASARNGVGTGAGLLFMETAGPVVAVAAGAAGAGASSVTAAFVAWGVIASASVTSPPAFVVGRAAAAAFIVARQII